jgi:tetratricopeptide (TPR) repeat protein
MSHATSAASRLPHRTRPSLLRYRSLARSAQRPALCWAFLVLLCSTSTATCATEQARVPARDEIVETQLAPDAVKQSVQRLERIRRDKGTSGAEAPPMQRITEAQRLIQAGRASGDPRTLGYAEARLAGVPDRDAAGVEALVLRATIEQSRHRFDEARVLLDRAIERAPKHVQARLTRATIGHVRGDLHEARADCDALREAAATVSVICRAVNDSLSGNNRQALKALDSINEASLRGWALSLAGEIHEQLGAPDAAVRAYSASLALNDDLYTTIALADVLISQHRWSQAEASLSPLPPTDAVLLRRYIVARRQQRDAASTMQAQLAARLADAQVRGELLHAREAALFALELGDVPAALKFARRNWNDQREPADLRILASAAYAANDSNTLNEVRGWLARTGLRDVRVERALAGQR